MSAPDWDGPDDPDNPRNWSLGKKIYHSAVPIAIGFTCPLGSSIYTAGLDDVEATLHTSREVAVLPFSLYLLGLSLGPIIAGPMSESFGRRAVYLSALPISALFTLGAGFVDTAAGLVVLRFLAGLFCSPGLSIGTGTVADVWTPETRTVPITTYVTMVQSGAAFGPLIGGFVASRKGWRWTQWTILFALAAVMLATLFMSETYKSQILKKRSRHASTSSKGITVATLRKFVTTTIARPLHMLLTEPIVGLFDLYVGLLFGMLNAFYAAFPGVFQKTYMFDLDSIGLTFVAQVVGNAIGWALVIGFNKLYYQPRSRKLHDEKPGERPPPEDRLYVAMLGGPMIPIALFWFAWTARPSVHWISPVAAEALFSVGNLLIFICASLYFTDCYGAQFGASAWSSNTFLRYFFAAVFPLFADQMYQTLGTGWATSLLGFIAALLVCIPFLFYIYGPALRRYSSYASEQ